MQTETTALVSITAVNVASAVAVWIATHRHEKKRREPTPCTGGREVWVRRWSLPRSADWDRLDGLSVIAVAELPCGGFLFADIGQGRLEHARPDEQSDSARRLGAMLLVCPKVQGGEFVGCPVWNAVRNGARMVVDVQHDLNPARFQPDAANLEWRLAGVPYFELPPYGPVPGEFEPDKRARGTCAKPSAVFNTPAPDLKEYLEADGDERQDGYDKSCGLHGAADDSTAGAGPQPTPQTPRR